jgi:hypothetical protein
MEAGGEEMDGGDKKKRVGIEGVESQRRTGTWAESHCLFKRSRETGIGARSRGIVGPQRRDREGIPSINRWGYTIIFVRVSAVRCVHSRFK